MIECEEHIHNDTPSECAESEEAWKAEGKSE